MSSDSIRLRVQQYYDEKIQTHGPTARGVDWNSFESQKLRFVQLLKLIERRDSFTLNDFGCGYGALADYLISQGYQFGYRGLDISPHMIAKAKDLHEGAKQIVFIDEESELMAADYTVASGIFNVKLNTPEIDWERYILTTLETINKLSTIGFAFNILTKYSDIELRRRDLYYADPLFFFDHCKREFSRFVTLLHDYPLFEFTILVRKAS
jgi:SAM-dependent methyltransferase